MSEHDSSFELEKIFSTGPVVVFSWSNEPGRPVEMVTPNVETILGYSREDFLEALVDYRDLILEEDRECVQQEVSGAIEAETDHVQHRNYRLRTKTGEIIWVSDFTHIERDADGKEQRFIGYILDITEQKRAEKAEQALREERERFEAILSSSIDGIFTVDGTGRFIESNEAFCRMTGYSREELYEMQIPDIEVLESRAETEEHVRAVIKNGSDRFTSKHRRKDGSVMIVELSVSYLPAFNGIIISIARDVTERVALEEDLRVARDRAEGANRAKSEFLANMSHEIRTPMNAVLGFAEVLHEKLRDDPELLKYVRTIESGGKALLGLINNVLDLSKIDAGKMETVIEKVNIRALVDETRRVLEGRALEKGISLEFHVEDATPFSLMTDATSIRQILYNLVGNAIKFTETGSVVVKFWFREGEFEAKGQLEGFPLPRVGLPGELFIRVEDTGIGIPLDQQKAIFQPFQQQNGQSTRKYGGTGLGLTISRRIIETLGGSIQLESRVNVGTAFLITLPVDAPNDSSPKQENISTSDYPAGKQQETQWKEIVQFKSATILLVEDQENNRLLVRSYLEDTDINIFEAENGVQALEQIETSLPDLVIMDLRMPEMDGYEAVEKIRAREDWKTIPVLALTAAVMKDEEDKVKNLFDECLRKPVQKNELFRTLSRFLPHTISRGEARKPLTANQNGGSQVKPAPASDLPSETDLEGDADRPMENACRLLLVESGESFRRDFYEQILPLLNQLKHVISIGDAVELSRRLKKIGMAYDCDELIHYGKQIEKMADSFDVGGMKESLRRFTSIMGRMALGEGH